MTVAHRVLLIGALAVLCACAKTPPGSGAVAKSAAAPQAQESSAEPSTPEGSQAAITPEAAQKAGIEVTAAGPAQIQETLRLYGTIKPNAEREQDIRARYPGVVRSVAKRAGEAVTKGEELLSVESNESLQIYPIRAPLSGEVLDRRANPGDAVDGSTVLMKVADLSSVWLEFAIFARDLGHVRPGMRVLFRDADASDHGEATITYVAPAGHSDSQSVVARAIVNNRNGRWVPGQFITGDISTSELQAPVAVKPAALQELQGKTVVFVQNGRGFELRPVQIGKRSREAVEISNGLSAGERYAAQNSYLIKADLLKSEAEED